MKRLLSIATGTSPELCARTPLAMSQSFLVLFFKKEHFFLPFFLLFLLPTTAHAHLVSSGLGTFYDGLLHPFVSLNQLLPLLAVALWAGGADKRAGRLTVLVLPLGWCAGGMVGVAIHNVQPFAGAVALGGLAAGVAGAALLRTHAIHLTLFATALGALLGAVGSAAADQPSPLLTLGMASGGALILLLATAQRNALQRPLTQVSARVLSSWIAAASLLQFGWILKGAGA